MARSIFTFGGGVSHGDPEAFDKALVGGKGAALAEMARLGLPVPPGFTITTAECLQYGRSEGEIADALKREAMAALGHIESSVGLFFGNDADPLLVSVRSGARVSMPGMMDTVLNIGLNDETVVGLALRSANERFAWDSYRRFIQMYASVVLGVGHERFEKAIETLKRDHGLADDTMIGAPQWRSLVAEFKAIVEHESARPFPQDPFEQLWGAIAAVFESWSSPRARVYRRLNDIPEEWGTAVNVQAMVFGNMGSTSATGVAFTRDPATGEKHYYGEYLLNAQGEDIVAGIRTPQYLTKAAREAAAAELPSMEEAMTSVFAELTKVFELLEQHYTDMQDIEFTVEQGKLYLLQTRSGKRSAKAAIKIAVEMVAEGLIDERTAISRIEPLALEQLLHPTLDPTAVRNVIGSGLPASPGAASGAIVLDADRARAEGEAGAAVILVRMETSPDDIHGMHAARAVLTARGGMTSHAAVVARGMGRPCVAGAPALTIDLAARTLRIGEIELNEGDVITLDGSSGEIMAGIVQTRQPVLDEDFAVLMRWADRFRRMNIRTNAETADDCRAAREFGAEGIGLCRTEHMFFDEQRISAVREMILANDENGRRAALAKLLPEQRSDFREIFQIMAGLPVTIRLLDPPLHEFLPRSDSEFELLAEATGQSVEQLRARADQLHEINPMLGHRGCRLGVTFPEIYEMQARAIFEAAWEVSTATAEAIFVEVMIPLVSTSAELTVVRKLIDRTAAQVFSEKGSAVDYRVGAMIELPRAALVANELAADADFFSFGTNDLTQTTLGVSRDDASKFLAPYVEKGIYAHDPFVTLDVPGVGQLIELAARRGREAKPGLKLGLCGEHGADPSSIDFCESVRLDYVSASPFRVPIARLAAAQASLARG